jgi:hypothetical protein
LDNDEYYFEFSCGGAIGVLYRIQVDVFAQPLVLANASTFIDNFINDSREYTPTILSGMSVCVLVYSIFYHNDNL